MTTPFLLLCSDIDVYKQQMLRQWPTHRKRTEYEEVALNLGLLLLRQP